MILTYYTATTMIVIAYLLGSIPSAVWIGKKYYGIDIREHGSKNAGTTNMLRVLGRRAALPVFALDFLKGFVAVTIIEMLKYDVHIGDNDLINLKIAAVFAAVLGHIFPVFAGFRGGKGVATLVGAVTGIYPPVALLCFGVWFVVLMVSHYVSLASMAAGCCFPLFTLISPKVNQSVPFVVFSFVIAILLIYTHRKNIERLKAGTESKTYIWETAAHPPRGSGARKGRSPGRRTAPERGRPPASGRSNRGTHSVTQKTAVRHAGGKPHQNLRAEFPGEPRNVGPDRLFQGRNLLVLRNGQGDRQTAPALQEGRHQTGRQNRADRPQQPPLVHHLYRNGHLRRGDRPHPAGLHPGRHHPHHQPLRKPAAVPGRQLLGR